MKYTSAVAFRTALETRLQSASIDMSIPLARLRKLVVFDCLMARLIIVAPNRWILKGAVALNYRKEARFRTTKDLDIGRHDNEEAATEDFIAVQSLDLNDHFTFTIERTEKLDSMEDGVAVRYHVVSSIAGRRLDDVTVDVGFGATFDYKPEILHSPDPAPPAAWDAAYGRMADEAGLNHDMNYGYKQVQLFLEPILLGNVKDKANWNPA